MNSVRCGWKKLKTHLLFKNLNVKNPQENKTSQETENEPVLTQTSLKRKSADDASPTDERWAGSEADSETTEVEVHEFEEDEQTTNKLTETDAWLEDEIEKVIAQEVESHLTSGTGSVLQTELDEKERRQREAAQKLEDARLDDLDDEELDQFILNEKEVEMKTRVWMELNREYLEKVAQKKEREANGELKVTKRGKSKPKSKPRDSDNPAGLTVEESVKNMINSKKKLSSKINYAIANSLFGKPSTQSDPKAKKLQRPVKGALSTHPSSDQSANDHVSLLKPKSQPIDDLDDDDDDDDDDDQAQEEEEIVHDAEFAMLKRANMMRDDDNSGGWGEGW